MPDYLSDSEVFLLLRGGPFGSKKLPQPNFWQKNVTISILLHPLVFSSNEILQYGWPFITFCSLNKFKIFISESLSSDYNVEIQKKFNENPPLFLKLQQLISSM
jgi:hypothetical protein